jgi:beta-lactam-binding protein with PASTA domain
MQGQRNIQFTLPPTNLIAGKQVKIPPVTCMSVQQATQALASAGFSTAVNLTQVASPCPAGTVASTSPAGTGSKGTAVTLNISNGQGGGGPGGGGTPPPGGGGGGGHAVPIFPPPPIFRRH